MKEPNEPKNRGSQPAKHSDELHNQNCFDYLKHLKLPIDPDFFKILSKETQQYFIKIQTLQKCETYQNIEPKEALGDLLSHFLAGLQQDHEKIAKYKSNKDLLEPDEQVEQHKEAYTDLLNSIFNNSNSNIERTHDIIKHLSQSQTPVLNKTASRIQKHLQDPWVTQNRNTPQKEETRLRRFQHMIAPNFMPQIYGTNLPNQVHYAYSKKSDMQELRFGTQAQRDQHTPRISPLFELWLETRTETTSHLYINKLKWGNPSTANKLFAHERLIEKNLSSSLHNMETYFKHITVITLPADDGLMDKKMYMIIEPTLSYQDAFNELLQATKPDEHSDLYIRPRTKQMLFGLQLEHQENKYTELLKQSFEELGFHPSVSSKLSKADQQAVWFHFINFKLTNFILGELKPATFNISCKDAIDRGAVASAYLNLMKSFETETPLTRDEFERALQTPATMVKARGMNHHFYLIWNAIDKYIDAHLDKLSEKQQWLIAWRDMNCPAKLANYLLGKRLRDHEQEQLKHGPHAHQDEQQMKNNVLEHINKMYAEGIGDSKLLLTIFSMTKTLSSTPDKETAQYYQKLSKHLTSVAQYRHLASKMTDFISWVLKGFKYKSAAKILDEKSAKLKNQSNIAYKLKELLNTQGFHASSKEKRRTDDVVDVSEKSHLNPPGKSDA